MKRRILLLLLFNQILTNMYYCKLFSFHIHQIHHNNLENLVILLNVHSRLFRTYHRHHHRRDVKVLMFQCNLYFHRRIVQLGTQMFLVHPFHLKAREYPTLLMWDFTLTIAIIIVNKFEWNCCGTIETSKWFRWNIHRKN